VKKAPLRHPLDYLIRPMLFTGETEVRVKKMVIIKESVTCERVLKCSTVIILHCLATRSEDGEELFC